MHLELGEFKHEFNRAGMLHRQGVSEWPKAITEQS